MNTTYDALEKARRDAQSLAKKVQANNDKSRAAVRAEALTVAAEAHQLQSAIKALLEGQAGEARQHLHDAVAALEALYKETNTLADAGDADVDEHNRASLARAREAVHKVSEALAAKRGLAMHA
jgi:uncharacterized protein (DUF58 family)